MKEHLLHVAKAHRIRMRNAPANLNQAQSPPYPPHMIGMPIVHALSKWDAYSIRPNWLARSHLPMRYAFATCIEYFMKRLILANDFVDAFQGVSGNAKKDLF